MEVGSNVVAIVSVITMFVIFPLVVGVVRYLWNRGNPDTQRSILTDGTAMRIAEMQQSLESMAVELERISENQRYVTKLLAEREKDPERLPERSR